MALTVLEKEFIAKLHAKKLPKSDKTTALALYQEMIDPEATDLQAKKKASYLLRKPEAQAYIQYMDKVADNAIQVQYTLQKEDAERLLAQIATRAVFNETETQDPDGNTIKKDISVSNKDVINALTLLMKMKGWEAPAEHHITGSQIIFTGEEELKD